ncbi:hypothetical protein QNI19_29790 [Cytophagaceae bacterium DM2B3-1]|uniref:Uncharacterized protein n=1 Tax=Xanthocytophaga flava TaxID=3048013 RepID=A0ABT7CTW5_9BACT|nr:hypothetical protein [Xanthocytophaga flavus]MDJ1471810.1 hypothetical protein [Xanthocytophaga flavus]MDJ1497168.1 hypothetical protein [Xanthocytophaga flavus]
MYLLKHLIFSIPFLLSTSLYAQEPDEQTIVAEGFRLYKSEMASWYGTDLFLEHFSGKKEQAEGYFSYTEAEENRCLFFSRGNDPKVLVTFIFDDTFNTQTARIDTTERVFTPQERDLYLIRKKALTQINQDTLFKKYQNTSLNLIPVVDKYSRKVYVLTGPQKQGVVIIGNDYLLTFDENNLLVSQKPLHKNIIPIDYAKDTTGVITMHTHLPETGGTITPTDICTLLLYQKYAHWQQHYVVSQTYVSIWDCASNKLVILTKEAWDRIEKHQDEKKKKQKKKREK